jgi:hypothetical protein
MDYAFSACLCLGTKEVSICETWCLQITKHLRHLLLLWLLLDNGHIRYAHAMLN